MNIIFKFHIIIFSVFLTSACSEKNDPNVVYEKYLVSIQNMDSFNINKFEPFISKRARTVVENKMVGAKKGQLEALLTLWKAEAVLPLNSNLTLSTEESTAKLNIVAKNYPESGTTQTTNVFFVKESDWKIDKVIIEVSNGDFNFKSTTF